MSESKVTPSSSRTNIQQPAPITSAVLPHSPATPIQRRSTVSQPEPSTSASASAPGSLRQVETPIAARSSKASRKALQALHYNLDAFFDGLPKPGGKAASVQDTIRLQELLHAMPADPDSAGYAEALDYTLARISRQGAAELVDLLLGLSAHRKRDKTCVAQLQAIVHCVQERLLSHTRESAAIELASLSALASSADDEAAAVNLRLKLIGLSDESLFAAAHCASPQLCLIAQEHVTAMQADSVRTLEAASTRLAAAHSGGGFPASPAELTSLVQDTVQALYSHERFCAIHGLPLNNKAQALRLSLDGLLRRPLERVELPLHQATGLQHHVICEALAVLEPMGAERPEDHFEAAYLSESLACVQHGGLSEALRMLKLAQDMRPQTGTGQRESLQANLLGQLFKRMPREHLNAWAKALDTEPIQLMMAAMDGIGSKVFAGQALGREIAERHQDLQEIRAALASALGVRVPKSTARFKDAIRNREVRQALTEAFPLQILDASPGQVEVFAKTGPVRDAAQAIFDEALARDLTQASPSDSKGDVEINGVRLAPGFLPAAQRVPCRAFNTVSQKLEPIVVAANPAKAVRQFMEMSGASPAQMTTLSRIYDADSRIDSAMLSPWSVLQLEGNTTVFPSLSPDGRRDSQVQVKQGPSGNLLVRFVTNFTGIASVLPIAGAQLLQPRAVAGQGGTAEFTHDLEIAPNGTCGKACLRRNYSLPRDATPHHPGLLRRVIAQDLVANPDSLRAVAQMVDRKLGTGYTEYLDNVDTLLRIPKHNTSQINTLAQATRFAWLQSDARSRVPGISAVATDRINNAIDTIGLRTAAATVDLVADAFRATQAEVAQIIFDQAKAILAANSAAKS
ncbi:hypothetical protein BH11PSE7_BH11PSE7_20380 [soil metagenome]